MEEERKAAIAEKLKREEERERKHAEHKYAKAAGGGTNKSAKIATILEVMFIDFHGDAMITRLKRH
jgi:hypothetical protein